MHLPVLQGTIRRRILANWRVDPGCLEKLLPHPLRPKCERGFAIAGVCLIRLEHIRPAALGAIPIGINSENAAHRVAVEWEEHGERKEGVFIWRRDSDSLLNPLAGGRLFPGVHGAATFEVRDDADGIDFQMNGADVSIRLTATESDRLRASSAFADVSSASRFFQTGSAGFSVTDDVTRLDGMQLATNDWHVRPLDVSAIASSFFSDASRFQPGAITFDHALIMRDVDHQWRRLPDLEVTSR
jgi:hypothetical protein